MQGFLDLGQWFIIWAGWSVTQSKGEEISLPQGNLEPAPKVHFLD